MNNFMEYNSWAMGGVYKLMNKYDDKVYQI